MESMSWSDDTRCLYCEGRLPLYRKITHGQFCSSAHRKAYWQEQERLAIERLHQTHTSLQAYRPPVPIQSILAPGHSPEPEDWQDPASTRNPSFINPPYSRPAHPTSATSAPASAESMP